MKRTTLYSSALTVCAAAALALFTGCDSSKKVIVTPPPAITPKFLYAASCGDLNPAAVHGARRHRPHRHIATPDGGTGTISGFSVDATTGALTILSGSPVVSGLQCPEFMATDPDQKFLFVPDESEELIHAYAIGSDGTLTEASGGAISQCAFQLAVDPTGAFLVAPDFCNDDIDVYSIGSDGSLTAVTGSPFAETSGNEPESVLIDPTGQWVYVADITDGPSTISAFALGSDGSLTELDNSPFSSGSFSYAITGTPDGKYIYLNDGGGNDIVAFSADSSTGDLTPLSTPSFPGGSCWLSVDATGKVLFSTDCNGNIFSSVIASDGSLTDASGSPVSAGSEPYPVTGDPSGAFVYAGDDSNPGQIFSYSYSSAGVLTAITGSPFPTDGTFIEGIVVTH